MPQLMRIQKNNTSIEGNQVNIEEEILNMDPRVLKWMTMFEPEVPIMESFVNNHPSLPIGLRNEGTPILARVITPYPLRFITKDTYDDIGAIVEKLKIQSLYYIPSNIYFAIPGS